MTACSGKCGRPGAGPIDSGRPGLDGQFTWCDECWHDLMCKRMPPGLAKDLPPGTLLRFQPGPLTTPELSAMARTEHKIVAGHEVKSVATVAAGPVADTGTLSGYLASFSPDHEGDQIMGPGAVADCVAAVNSGAMTWHLTNSHSDRPSDVVATVTHAVVDGNGVRVAARWAPTAAAQELRAMARAGHQLGMSIDYTTDSARPNSRGGRDLHKITIHGGAVVNHPMNSACRITESKYAATAPVVPLYDSIQAEAGRNHPDREQKAAEDAMLAGLDWPPRSWDRSLRLSVLAGCAETKARRELAADTGQAREQARRDQDNAYSYGLAAWMSANRR